jgi:hypothetical protein
MYGIDNFMVKIKYSSLKIFVSAAIFLFLQKSALATPALVSHVGFDFEQGNMTFYTGTESGIKPGDIIEVVRDGVPIVRAEALEVEPFYTRAKILMAAETTGKEDFLKEISVSTPAETARPPEAGISNDKIIVMDKDLGERMARKEIKFDFKGYRYMMFRSYSSSGNDQNFLSYNGLLTRGGRIEQGTDLNVKTTYGEKTTLEGDIYEIPLQERVLKFSLNTGQYKGLFGDFQVDFRSGSFATINKQIVGAEAQYTTNNVEADWFTSQSKSTSKTITFTGDNTHGPFSLDTFQMIENSETVKLNGQVISRDDYGIDYYSGQISFCNPNDQTNCTEIKNSDTVQVSFEEKSTTGGAINGMSTKYKFSDDTFFGVAYLAQDANAAAKKIKSSKTWHISGQDLINAATSTIPLPQTGTNYPAYRFLVQEARFISVKKNGSALQYGVDYTMDDTTYLLGRIPLNVAPAATDEFVITYTYYEQEFVNEVRDEKLYRTGGEMEFILNGSQTGVIYPGSEAQANFGVYFCNSDPCIKDIRLQPGADYTIVDDNTLRPSAAYLPDTDDEYILISYLTVPYSGPQSSEYNHTVSQIYGGARVGSVDIAFEFGQSQSDISTTPIQILNEKIVKTSNAIVCQNSDTPANECRYTLHNKNIVEWSEKIHLSTSDTPLVSGVNYTLDDDTATLVLTGGIRIDADTLIYADYQYNPDIASGIQTGNASKISLASQIGNYNLSLKSGQADTFFAPLSGNNSLETSRLDFSLSGNITDSLTINLANSNFDVASDISESSTVSNNQFETSLGYKHGNQTFDYSFGKDTASDGLPEPVTDQTRTNHKLSISADDLWRPGLKLSFTTAKENYSDIADDNDSSSASNKLGVGYKIGDNISLETAFTTDSTSSTGATPHTTSTDGRAILLTYIPWNLVTITADIDHQRKNDSRPAQGSSGKDTSGVSVVVLDRGNFQSINFNLTEQSYPSYTSGDSQSQFADLNFTYLLSSSLTFTPTVSKTQYSSAGSSSSTDASGVKFEFRPRNKPFELSTSKDWSDTTSSTTGSDATTSSNDTLDLDLNYKFGEHKNLLYRYEQRQNESRTSSTTATNQSLRFGMEKGEKAKYSLTYAISDSSSASSTSKKSLLFQSRIALSKILRWNTEFTMTDYADSDNSVESFKGNLITSELRAEF